MELLIVTGMSGSGKTNAAHVLEDIGYYCVDNIPPTLIPAFAETMSGNNAITKAAVVTDARGGSQFNDIMLVLDALSSMGISYKILFLDCSDEVLSRRYKETRRRHPLFCDGMSVMDAVKQERELLAPVRRKADYIIVTSQTSTKQMREQLTALFLGNPQAGLSVRCMSFGFKYGVAAEADLMFDLRCLPNPFYVDHLRPLTGLDNRIKDYVLKNDITEEFKSRLLSFLDYSLPLYCAEGKSQLVIAVGCTGGKHRSVVFAELIGEYLKNKNYSVNISHRDISKQG